MFDLIKMVFILTLISTFSGFSLSLLHEATKEPIEMGKLNVVYAPSIKELVEGYDNDPVADRVKLKIGTDERGKDIVQTLFPCKKNGETFALALDAKAGGFGGDLSVLLIVDLQAGTLENVAVLTHAETKGIGTSLEPPFIAQFSGRPVTGPVDLKARGGKLDGMSGATYSSIGITDAVRKGLEMYNQHVEEL
ncbi:MAG: FMN-binding protein, partial [bacterium]